MRAEQALQKFKELAAVTSSEVQAVLANPAERQALYKLLLSEQLHPMAPLIRAAFQKEVEYRDALWERTVEDDGNSYEGIYRCAFLLYCLGTPDDIPALWQAKYLNMDVGTSMGAEFFIGAGLNESIKFIENAVHPESTEIAAYIQGWFSQSDAMQWQKAWEEDMRSNISDA
ncbi:hypothetical protein [Jeongeupia naejangsanensis]|uniref:Uncharacterized protein n=1 Tax=Jeongeupia naejangsanensis TaxID=613195 RepID=A0ABS2BKC9_9NEIS|nr:hypothetical protein [Jeongeupia naejangsanensis]MBM3116072.1 hypothetical protein [Jeongeupia naejangsanensis]